MFLRSVPSLTYLHSLCYPNLPSSLLSLDEQLAANAQWEESLVGVSDLPPPLELVFIVLVQADFAIMAS